MTQRLACLLLLLLLTGICAAPLAGADLRAEHHPPRKVLKKFLPTYPELARQFSIKGAVKLLVTVEPNGKVRAAKAVGGNPTLVDAAMQVIDKWKFEPAAGQSTETVEIKFEPTE